MRKLFFSILFFASVSGYAQAQSSNRVQGSHPNPDAPVNVSAPGLRPAQPAQHSSTDLPQHMKGQFYVKDDKPADAAGNPIVFPAPPQPAKADVLKNQQPAPASGTKSAGTKPATKKSSK